MCADSPNLCRLVYPGPPANDYGAIYISTNPSTRKVLRPASEPPAFVLVLTFGLPGGPAAGEPSVSPQLHRQGLASIRDTYRLHLHHR
jgi:hypothetical protein